MTSQPLQQSFGRPVTPPFQQSYAAAPVAHDPWRWLVGPAMHAAAVVVAGVVLAVLSTVTDGRPGLVGSLLQSGLGMMGTPFSLAATALDPSAPPVATAMVLVLAALVWVVPHAAVSYHLAERRR
ncbi:hypothetical protein [uncultured Nocardioides sp.]|uniref:hypothetical protein n=1 Tax=uncultured Nocardioides sp. TaxID=198441 RepID=UPI0026195DA1|nr:hypothetical protein [uncultured Nocardioides sp.]